MRSPVRTVRARRSVGASLTVMLLAAVALPALLAAGPASAQATSSTAPDVSTLRAQADDIANQYFRALPRWNDLETEIARNAQLVSDLSAKAKQARQDARARALLAYTTSGDHLDTLIDEGTVLESARGAQMIYSVTAREIAVYAKLRATTEVLRTKRKDLDATRAEQA